MMKSATMKSLLLVLACICMANASPVNNNRKNEQSVSPHMTLLTSLRGGYSPMTVAGRAPYQLSNMRESQQQSKPPRYSDALMASSSGNSEHSMADGVPPVPSSQTSSNVAARARTLQTRLYSSVASPLPGRLRIPRFFRSPVRKYRQVRLPDLPPPALEPEAVVANDQMADKTMSAFDVSLFLTYLCNIIVVTLPVVVVPAAAMEFMSTASPTARATFIASTAAAAPLGGFIGKLINGFVCQKVGGHRSSYVYLSILSVLAFAMSMAPSIAWIAPLVLGYEFLSSIQWISICQVLGRKYKNEPLQISKGVASLGMASVCGALIAKTLGAAVLKASGWRTVARFSAGVAATGSLAMMWGCRQRKEIAPREKSGGLGALKSVVTNPLFWQLGVAHSLGYIVRGSDRLLSPFLESVSGLPGHLCATMTSSVTVGMFYGLIQGQRFSKMTDVKEKVGMLRKKYLQGTIATLGLALCCGLASTSLLGGFLSSPVLIASLVTIISGYMASTVSFQFYQFPNLISSNLFEGNSAIALSLLDALAYCATAQILSVNSKVISNFGWSASWSFMTVMFALGGGLMVKSIPSVLSLALSKTSAKKEAVVVQDDALNAVPASA